MHFLSDSAMKLHLVTFYLTGAPTDICMYIYYRLFVTLQLFINSWTVKYILSNMLNICRHSWTVVMLQIFYEQSVAGLQMKCFCIITSNLYHSFISETLFSLKVSRYSRHISFMIYISCLLSGFCWLAPIWVLMFSVKV